MRCNMDNKIKYLLKLLYQLQSQLLGVFLLKLPEPYIE